MKKILFILPFLLSVNVVFAQKELKEGSFTYKFSDIKVKKGKRDPIETPKMYNGAEMTVYFNTRKQRIDMDFMDGFIKTQVFINLKEKTARHFTNVMKEKRETTGMDSIYRYELKNIDKNAQKATKLKSTGKTKDILGYKCEEFVFTQNMNDKIITSTMYITKDFKINKNVWKSATIANIILPMPSNSNLEGFPMEIVVDDDEMSVTMLVSKIEKKEKSIFDVPEGYYKIDINELRNAPPLPPPPAPKDGY